MDEFQPVPASSLRWLDDAQRGKWRRAATSGYALAAWGADDGPQPVSDDWVQLQGDDIVVRPPAELVPYGVVRIFAKADDLLVGTRLLPLPKYGPVRSNRCGAYRIVGDRDPRTLNWYAQPATLETLEWFPAAEVEQLLQRGDVQGRDELRNRVELLLELAREREAPG